MNKLIIIVSALLYISCKTGKEAMNILPKSNSDLVQQNASEKILAKYDSLLVIKIEKIKNDGFTYKSFECCKDQILASKLYRRLRLDFRYSIKIEELDRSIIVNTLLDNYSYLAKGGNLEIENYLLEFYDDLISELIKQNHEYSDGPGLDGNLFHRLNGIRSIQILPPSKRKIDLYYRLAGQEPSLGKWFDDIPPVHGDFKVLEFISNNIDIKYFEDIEMAIFDIPLSDRSAFVRSYLDKIYNGIMSNEIPLKDRNEWILRTKKDNDK